VPYDLSSQSKSTLIIFYFFYSISWEWWKQTGFSGSQISNSIKFVKYRVWFFSVQLSFFSMPQRRNLVREECDHQLFVVLLLVLSVLANPKSFSWSLTLYQNSLVLYTSSPRIIWHKHFYFIQIYMNTFQITWYNFYFKLVYFNLSHYIVNSNINSYSLLIL
jgi:hypothetical protein